MHVEEGNRLHTASVRVLADGAYILNPHASTVVGLEHDSVFDVEIVVNSAVVGGLEGAGPLGLSQVGQVDDVGDGNAVCDNPLDFVKLVVEKDELVPVALGPPALVSVGGAGVLKTAEHLGVSLVGRVPDGDGVLVVGDADVAAVVLLVRSVVGNTLSIVSVAIRAGAAGLVWV